MDMLNIINGINMWRLLVIKLNVILYYFNVERKSTLLDYVHLVIKENVHNIFVDELQ